MEQDMSEWVEVYRSTDQTIEQMVTGTGEDAVVSERVTWHTDTPERKIERLEAQVNDLQDQATGKITKAQLVAKLAPVDTPTKGVI